LFYYRRFPALYVASGAHQFFSAPTLTNMGVGRSKPLNDAARAAQDLRKGAEGNLRNALTQYINAVKGLENTARSNADVRRVLNATMFKKNGTNTTNSLSKVFANSVAKIVQSSSQGLWAAANAGAAQKAANNAAQNAAAKAAANAAAARLKKAAKNVKELNSILTNIFKNSPNNNARAAAYTAARGNAQLLNANIALNRGRKTMLGRPAAAKYNGVWNKLSAAASATPTVPVTPVGPASTLSQTLQNLKTVVNAVQNVNAYAEPNANARQALREAVANAKAALVNANKNNINAQGKAIRNKANAILEKLASLNLQASGAGAPPPAGTATAAAGALTAAASAVNRAALNTLLSSTNNATVGTMNNATVNARIKAIRNAAREASVNVTTNANTRTVLNRLNARKAALNAAAAPAAGQ
jgi:hypothetical protein